MPSWTRSRSEKPKAKYGEKDSKLHTQALIGNEYALENNAQPVKNTQDGLTHTPFRRNRRFRDSVVSFSAVNESSGVDDSMRLDVPRAQERSTKNNRFSLLKFRHASDSQLSKTAKEHAEQTPPIPNLSPPSIITTAPTLDTANSSKRKSTLFLPRRTRPATPEQKQAQELDGDLATQSTPHVTFDQSAPFSGAKKQIAPPAYGDEANSALALPVSRVSDSSRSEASSGEHAVFATTTTTHTVSTTTTFFRLPRRKKDKGPLFPLPPKVSSGNLSGNGTPRLSGGQNTESPVRAQFSQPDQSNANGSPRRNLGFGVERSHSRASTRSGRPSSAIPRTSNLDQRGRSSTMTSHRRGAEDESVPTPPMAHSTRTSTSTAGRPSLAGLFNLSRLRQSSEPMFSRGQFTNNGPETPSSMDSKQTSFNLPREPPVIVPERQEGDTPAKYLARLEEVVSRGALVSIITKLDDEFTRNVLRSFMRRFSFFEEPLDMATRKLLTQVQLPKETQQIDRTVQSFADRYHECNPGIFPSSDDAYFVAFSLIILHTDVFNSNNKHKMQKRDYVKNSTRKETPRDSHDLQNNQSNEGNALAVEILECFYDNIIYTPFIHVEDEVEMTSERLLAHKASKKGTLKGSSTISTKRGGSEPIDPYLLIFDGKLGNLRPPLQDVLSFEDPFNYIGTAKSINVSELNRCFFRYGIIQILSSRSRPDAFMHQATISNPAEAQIGVVDMKVTKVGTLWRKDAKKKKTRSPWQEWGAILTGSQLYFFRNTSWVKNLMHQYESHRRNGKLNTPVVFRPPLEQFKPDFLLSTDQVVALTDSEYRKHKHAFFVMRQTSYQEVFLAEDEADMNDWLAKINYAATFRTTGVRMKGIVNTSFDQSKSQDSRKIDSRSSGKSNLTADPAPSQQPTKADEELARQIIQARRQIMVQKISEAQAKVGEFESILDGLLRTARHFCVLTPIQTRTRDELSAATLRLATSIRWARVEMWRACCSCDILQLDIDEDSNGPSERLTTPVNKIELTPYHSKEKDGRAPLARFSSKGGVTSSPSSSRSRPANQPTGTKLFSMDEIFRSPSRTRQQAHKAKGSWELPPLEFERGRSVSISRNSRNSSRRSSAQLTEQNSRTANLETVYTRPEPSRGASTVSGPPLDGQDEHHVLVEAGVVAPEPPIPEPVKEKENLEQEEAKVKPLDTDEKEGLAKVRHSLRKLQGAHGPSHHRSKKVRDSTISNAISEDSTSTADSEGLARASGSFTVHGKKASVITFGSEWQNIAQDRRTRLSTQEDELKPPPAGMSFDGFSHISRRSSSLSRPSTADTTSTVKSLGFATPVEQVSDSVPASPRSNRHGEITEKVSLLANGDQSEEGSGQAETVTT